ncbi:MAG: anaerobic ribonucleoside-triphosphate reductase activating protein [Mycoplasmataceae bacterium]|nr:anaerobic ribonucleoside-triphosphate reductase activating protein [Mycoplasmataceae bacterium]
MVKQTVRLSGITPQSLVNGPGLRKVYFAQGCKHHCKDCFNPETWSFQGGRIWDVDQLVKEIKEETYLEGVTFSGGDPVEQAEGFATLGQKLKQQGFNIWCYTGYTWEELMKKSAADKNLMNLLKTIDVIVDGKYVNTLHSHSHKYRGSSNQRLINVAASLKAKKAVEFKLV